MSNNALHIVADASNSQELNTFQLLWNKIERFEQRNAKAKTKVDNLYKDYEITLLPYEKKYGASHCALIAHLLSFVPSNNFKKKDRLNLLEYLLDNLHDMHDAGYLHDLKIVDKLHKECDQYYQKYFSKEHKQEINAEYDKMKDMINMMMGEEVDLPDKEIKEAIVSGDFSKFESLMKKVREDHMSNKNQQEDDWEDFKFNYYKDEDDESSKVTEIFKASQLNKMYKKIANIIHPDKEQCSLKKEERHKQMQSLLAAKKEADVFTLVKMYREFVPNGEYLLDDDAMEHVENLLRMRIQKLNREHRNTFNEQGLKSFIWKRYSSTSRKRSLQKMELHVLEVRKHTIVMDNQVKQLSTAQKIKKLLLNSQ